MSVCLKQRVSDPLAETVQFIIDYDTRPQLVFKQTVIHGVIPELGGQLIPICREWIFHGPSEVLHYLCVILKFLLEHKCGTCLLYTSDAADE